ncbi:hypothetical protein ACSFA0_25945 [Variovorax sp. LT1P1]|uniref:hypothetical protein n=1 Tax=Variovorax sp. LT1P1 TaxID=3443730 RepID=UPI003F45A802
MANQPVESKDTPLQQLTMKMAKEMILLNLFRRFQGTRPEWEDQLQAAYEKKYGRPMRASTTGRDVRAFYLEGEPGHGKTTTHREACKEFAGLVGLQFMEDPSLTQMERGMIGKNTFVFTTLTVAGATSKHEVGGLMAKMRIGDQDFMGHLPDWRMAASMLGAFGYVLFDDFVTSSHQVQNACLDLLLGGSAGDFQFNMKEVAESDVSFASGQVTFTHNPEKAKSIDRLSPGDSFRGASPVHIGLAGNRGSRDGNKVFPITTATATRIQRADVRDTVEDFVARSAKRYPDEVGDAMYATFVKGNPELFSAITKPINGVLPAMPCPRTHDAMMDAAGVLVHNAGGFDALARDDALQRRFVDDIELQAGTHIGREIEIIDSNGKPKKVFPAAAVGGFYQQILLGAMPKASDIIKKGEVDEDFVRNKYNQGMDANGMDFGFQFASALAAIAATEVGEKIKAAGKSGPKELEKLDSALSMDVRRTMMHFSYGLSFLQATFVAASIDKFLARVNVITPEVFEGSANYRTPKESFLTCMVYGLVPDNKRFNVRELRTTFADSLSQATNGYLNGLDATIQNGVKKRKDALNAAISAAAPK